MRTSGDGAPYFLRIRCQDCKNEQVTYSHASSRIECRICGKTLAKPSGGKAEIEAEVLETY